MPRLSNILRHPEVVSVVHAESSRPDRAAVEVRVAGLACESVCVRRTERALRSLPGVADVRFEAEPDRFTVETDGRPIDQGAAARAVHSVVVAPWARRLIAAIAERLGLPRRS